MLRDTPASSALGMRAQMRSRRLSYTARCSGATRFNCGDYMPSPFRLSASATACSSPSRLGSEGPSPRVSPDSAAPATRPGAEHAPAGAGAARARRAPCLSTCRPPPALSRPPARPARKKELQRPSRDGAREPGGRGSVPDGERAGSSHRCFSLSAPSLSL